MLAGNLGSSIMDSSTGLLEHHHTIAGVLQKIVVQGTGNGSCQTHPGSGNCQSSISALLSLSETCQNSKREDRDYVKESVVIFNL